MASRPSSRFTARSFLCVSSSLLVACGSSFTQATDDGGSQHDGSTSSDSTTVPDNITDAPPSDAVMRDAKPTDAPSQEDGETEASAQAGPQVIRHRRGRSPAMQQSNETTISTESRSHAHGSGFEQLT